MKIPKKHAPTLFLLIMVFIMVIVMSLVLGFVNGAYVDDFMAVWPRQFLIAFTVAVPAAFMARWLATATVTRITE